jgi:hypothetical protein
MNMPDACANGGVNGAAHAARLAGAAAAHLDPTPVEICRRQLGVTGLEDPIVGGGVAELTHEGCPLPRCETAHTCAQPVHALDLGEEAVWRR